MKRLLIFTICFLSVAGQISPRLSACGYSEDFEDYSMFAPEIVGEEDAEFFRTIYYSIKVGEHNQVDMFKQSNVDLWHTFFNKEIPATDLNKILYKYHLQEIDELIFKLKGKKKTKIKNKILQFSNVAKAKSFLYYIGFAKNCEGVNRKAYYWGDEDKNVLKPSEVESFIKGGLANFKVNPYPLIKQRYAMQLTRLHFALGLDKKKKSKTTGLNAYQFYQKYRSVLTPNSNTDLRTKAYAAGHLKRIGQKSRANVLYAQLHQNLKMKHIGQMGYSVQDPIEFQKTETLATNVQDKITLWKLQGLELDGISAIKAIYKLKPNAPELDVLLMRAVNMQEEDLDYALKYGNRLLFAGIKDEYAWPPQNYDTQQHTEIYEFIKTVADKENTHSKYAWHLAAGYLSAIQGRKEDAQVYLKKAKNQAPKNTLVQQQVRLLGLINNLENFVQLDEEFKLNTLIDLKWLFNQTESHHADLRTDVARAFARKKLSYIHYNARQPLLAHFTSPFYESGFYAKINNLNKLEAFIEKSNKTDWEKFMLALYLASKEDVHYMKGLINTYRGNFDAAITEFDKNKDIKGEFYVDVFDAHINDCNDCDRSNYKGKAFSAKELVKEQKAMMEQIRSNQNLSTNYFKLANSYYNISYFGNNRSFYYQTKLVSYSPYYYEHYAPENFISSPLNFLYDNRLSLKYYLFASQNSKDPEFKAKCHYMAAKCERNAWYSKHQNKNADEFDGGVYFGKLKKNFSHTKYYQEIIKECGYFESYLNRNND